MGQYKIRIVETLSRVMEIDAPSETEALEQVRQDYRDEKVVLCADDFDDVSFDVEK